MFWFLQQNVEVGEAMGLDHLVDNFLKDRLVRDQVKDFRKADRVKDFRRELQDNLAKEVQDKFRKGILQLAKDFVNGKDTVSDKMWLFENFIIFEIWKNFN